MAEPLRSCPHCGGEARYSQVLPGPGERFGCSKCAIDAFTADDWNRRTPGPATKAMLEWVKARLPFSVSPMFQAFLAEWLDTDTPPAPEQPAPSSPWECALCGRPISIADDLQPYHTDPAMNQLHGAMLSDADKKVLADGLGLKG